MSHQSNTAFFGKSETAELANSIDWAHHPLGPIDDWDQSLKTSISLAMRSKFPMFLTWGKHKYFFYNDAYAPILGIKHPKAFGQKFEDVWADIWTDLIPLIESVENDEAVYLEDLKLIMNRKGFDEETYFTFSYSPIHSSSGKIDGLFCAVVETTNRVFTERALKNREAEVVNVLDGMSDGFITVDKNWMVKRVNTQFEKIVGMGRDLVVGNNFIELFFNTPELSESLYMKNYSKVMNERVSSLFVDHYEPLNIWTSVSAFPTQDGGMAIFFKEISEERRAAKALQDAINSRDEFISIASHELKTPLTSLKLQAQLQKKHGVTYSAERMNANNERILNLVNRLDRLVEDMLDISRLNTGRLKIIKENVDINQICTEVIEHMDIHFKEITGESLMFSSPGPVMVNADKLRLEQVLTNLLQNALKYGNSKPVHMILIDHPHQVEIKVTDQGLGIPEDLKDRIFNRFERAISANEVSGLGLGLYISKQILTAHNGDIQVESKQGEGSTFTVTLPK